MMASVAATEMRSHRLRRQSEHLAPLDIQNDNHRNLPSFEDTAEEGRALFGHFMEEELQRQQDLETPEEIYQELHQLTPQGYANPHWARAGQDLRRYADAFMRSRERRRVRDRAFELVGRDDVDGQVTEDQFRDFLRELLLDGITRERIIVLFVFCADVAIATLKRKAQSLCHQLIQWSVRFISEYVCNWVREHGGWDAVFGMNWVYVKRAFIAFGVCATAYFFVKKAIHWKNS